MEEVSGYALDGVCWQDRSAGWGFRLGGCRMKDDEDMLEEGGWDDCACFVKYHAIHCVYMATKVLVFTECWW